MPVHASRPGPSHLPLSCCDCARCFRPLADLCTAVQRRDGSRAERREPGVRPVPGAPRTPGQRLCCLVVKTPLVGLQRIYKANCNMILLRETTSLWYAMQAEMLANSMAKRRWHTLRCETGSCTCTVERNVPGTLWRDPAEHGGVRLRMTEPVPRRPRWQRCWRGSRRAAQSWASRHPAQLVVAGGGLPDHRPQGQLQSAVC